MKDASSAESSAAPEARTRMCLVISVTSDSLQGSHAGQAGAMR